MILPRKKQRTMIQSPQLFIILTWNATLSLSSTAFVIETRQQEQQQQHHHHCHLKSCFPKTTPSNIAKGGEITLSASFNPLQNGLTDDGDFALLGVNIHHDENEEEEKKKLAITPTPLTTALPWSTIPLKTTSEFSSSISATIPTKTTSSITTTSVTAAQSTLSLNNNNNNNNNSADESETRQRIKNYLQSILPNLSSSILLYYTQQMHDIGFDPTCKSRFELECEDLSPFMKILHARFVYHEIMKEEGKGYLG